MGFFWSFVESVQSEDRRRLYIMRRRVYLASVLLMSLICFETVLCYTATVAPLWFRIFNIMVAFYAVGLLAYSTYWLFQSWLYGKKQQSLALKDHVTGLLNREGLVKKVRDRWTDQVGGGAPVRLLYVRMVGLDRVDSVHGPAVGERVLAEAAGIVQDTMPEGCSAGRVSGDEFVILLKGADIDRTRKLSERIVERIGEHDFITGEVEVQARTALAADVSGAETLRDVLADVRLKVRSSAAPGRSSPDDSAGYPIPRVTLGAYARFHLDSMEPSLRNQFHTWREYPGREFLARMGEDLLELLSLRADRKPFDFVTAPPTTASMDGKKPAEHLARKVAELLEAPYRQAMVASPLSPAGDQLEPKVAIPVENRTSVLLVSDLIEDARYLRRCVEKLCKAGASVQAVGWAARI